MSADWRTKYLDMKAKMLRATDVAYRLGYEEGMKAASQQQMQQQMQQQQEEQAMMQQAMMQGGQPMPEEGGQPEEMPPGAAPGEEVPQEEAMAQAMMGDEEEMPEEVGSELDQHINELESLVAKGEKPSVVNLRKAVEKIADIRKSQKSRNKVEESIVPAQKRFVDNILKKWEKEADKTDDALEDILKEHGVNLEE